MSQMNSTKVPRAKSAPYVVSAASVNSVISELSRAKDQDEKRSKDDRQQRAENSRSKVKNWKNTIAGTRQQRIEARKQQLAAEEAERERISKLHDEESALLRQQIINKAKELRFYEKDIVKEFHSKLLECHILKERDLQVKMKHERKDYFKIIDDEYKKSMNERAFKELAEEKKRAETAKTRRDEMANDLLTQMKLKQKQQEEEQKKKIEEGKKIIQKDEEEKQKQKELEEKRRKEREEIGHFYVQAREQARVWANERKQKEKEDEARIQAWAERKDKNESFKKTIEKTRFEEYLKYREELASFQKAQEDNYEAEVNARIEKSVQKKEEEARKRIEMENEKRKKAGEDLKAFILQKRQIKAEEAKKEKEEEELQIKYYQKTVEEYRNAQKAKKQADIAKSKELRNIHLQQMAEAQEKRRQALLERRSDEKAAEREKNEEEQMLMMYMQSISKQSWATSNSRLQDYISARTASILEKTNATAEELGKITEKNKNRIGFVGGYTSLDLVGANEVVKGSPLQILGKSVNV